MSDQPRNLLLSSLPAVDRERLLEKMEPIPLRMRESLAEPGRPMTHVYFPVDGIISVLTVLDGGGAVESASVGWEGMAGVEIFLGATGTDNARIVCQVDGEAWRMDAATFREESRPDGPFRRVVERYARAFLVQTTQSAACNGAHSVEERFSKWICLITDWLERDEFPLTHEFAAALLGVHRPSVTLAAGALQRAGIIKYTRGRMTVLDREELEDVACECYAVIRRAYDELKGPIRGDGPGAVLRYAAMVESTRLLLVRARAESARAAYLVAESTHLGRRAQRLKGRVQPRVG